MDTDYISENRALKRKIEREIASRKQAEKLLEEKSLALFETNQKLALAINQLEKSSAENLVKLEFQKQIDAMMIHFGRMFLTKNLDDVVLDNFVQKLSENALIEKCGLTITHHKTLGLVNASFGKLICHNELSKKRWQGRALHLSLAINNEQLGLLCIQITKQELDLSFIERALVLVAELLCGAINRQHTIYRHIESRKIAEKSERSTRDFLAMINHELRTPLHGLMGTSALLNETALSNEQKLLMSDLIQSGELLRSIINDLLDYSKINSGMFALFPTQFKIQSLMQRLKCIFEQKVKEKGLLLTMSLGDALPKKLEGDLERITQIFVNLIGNAIKFTDKGSITVSLQWQHNAMHFSVKDTGIGICETLQHKLFQPFIQVDRSSKRSYEGTGLGLAICQQLIKLMGGNIALKSKANFGAEFYGFIPLNIITDEKLTRLNAPIQSEVISTKLAILVVDDIALNQVIIKEMLKKMGIMADIATNGIEALNQAQKKDYDLIFMDCRMPEMDGFEATLELRKRQFEKTIIALTAGTTRSERKKCLESGMNDILTKPYTADELKAIIVKWIS